MINEYYSIEVKIANKESVINTELWFNTRDNSYWLGDSEGAFRYKIKDLAIIELKDFKLVNPNIKVELIKFIICCEDYVLKHPSSIPSIPYVKPHQEFLYIIY
jgi:hypothetical protein